VLCPDTVYALELCVRVPVAEWGGQPVRMALEEGVALTEDGVSYLGDRQTELLLIPTLRGPRRPPERSGTRARSADGRRLIAAAAAHPAATTAPATRVTGLVVSTWSA
jgi:hypothetical protein